MSESEVKGIKKILWANILALMNQRYGGENIYRFNKDSGVPLATLSRMKALNSSTRLDVLERIATKMNLEPWQLLQPNWPESVGHMEDDHPLNKWKGVFDKASPDEKKLVIGLFKVMLVDQLEKS